MRRIVVAAVVCAAALSAAGTSSAQSAKPPRPEALNRLTACHTLADGAERLACYDREVAAVDAAEARKDLVVVDREQLRTTRRTLFGLTLPNLSVFGDDNQDEEGVSRVETTIKRLSQTPYGKWVFTLQDGAQWEQIDRPQHQDPQGGNGELSRQREGSGCYSREAPALT
jgi:hypothetical protein